MLGSASGPLPAPLLRAQAAVCLAAALWLSGCDRTGAPTDAVAEPSAAAAATPASARPEPPTRTASMRSPAVPRSACHEQGGTALAIAARRALGTEPFWSATIDGRCVTYATPADQRGTRVWTRYREAAGVESWSGALNGRPFRLQLRAQPACSDGMSDRIYPWAARLEAGGTVATGCAAAVP